MDENNNPIIMLKIQFKLNNIAELNPEKNTILNCIKKIKPIPATLLNEVSQNFIKKVL